MAEKVLVTGGFGLVGSQTVRKLVTDGHDVVATDLGTDAQRKAAATLPAGTQVRWVDLTDPGEVKRLVAEVSPTVIVHLAALIIPAIYRQPELGRRVNVDATVALLRAAESSPRPPRFVQASSNAVYGARNPHRHEGLLRADSPVRPSDLYGAHKAEAEEHVVSSDLEWVILRLGGVISVEPGAMPFTSDALYFESALPTDGRLHTVDVRDVAAAFAAAATADVAGEILLIGGDESHLHRQKDIGLALAAARGLSDALPPGRPGDPDSDEDVRHRLAGHRPGPAGVGIPAALLAGDARGDARRRRLAALPDAPSRPLCPAAAQTPGRLSTHTGPLRRPLGRHPGEAG